MLIELAMSDSKGWMLVIVSACLWDMFYELFTKIVIVTSEKQS